MFISRVRIPSERALLVIHFLFRFIEDFKGNVLALTTSVIHKYPQTRTKGNRVSDARDISEIVSVYPGEVVTLPTFVTGRIVMAVTSNNKSVSLLAPVLSEGPRAWLWMRMTAENSYVLGSCGIDFCLRSVKCGLRKSAASRDMPEDT